MLVGDMIARGLQRLNAHDCKIWQPGLEKSLGFASITITIIQVQVIVIHFQFQEQSQ